MLCEARVFHFRKADDSLFGQVNLRLDCVGIAEVEVAGMSMEQIAAQAWIEVVGHERRETLDALHAPQVIVQAPIDRDAIVAELQDTPTACHVLYGFVYDNQAETWLIELDADFDFCGAGVELSDAKHSYHTEYDAWFRLQKLVSSVDWPCCN